MKNNVKITTGRSLGKLLDTVISESVKAGLYQKSLQEKEKQDAMASNAPDPAPSPPADSQDEKSHGSKTAEDEKSEMESGDIDHIDVIEKLNTIRSGHSFRDEKVASAMEQYINSLSSAEKTALLAFLKGIAQIVTGEVAAQDAADPGDKPSDVKMEKGPKTKHIKPNVIVSQTPKVNKDSGAENTSGPTPITPKKKL
jgi:ribosomal protein L12E/L44/L45/RPP1/RPP2